MRDHQELIKKLEKRAIEIHDRLRSIDTLSIRPIRAMALGEANMRDKALLKELEKESKELRIELCSLKTQVLKLETKADRSEKPKKKGILQRIKKGLM
jgi:hypothetical protein